MSLVLLLDFSAVAAEESETAEGAGFETVELVGMGRFAGFGLIALVWLETGACVEALGVGVV